MMVPRLATFFRLGKVRLYHVTRKTISDVRIIEANNGSHIIVVIEVVVVSSYGKMYVPDRLGCNIFCWAAVFSGNESHLLSPVRFAGSFKTPRNPETRSEGP